MKSILAMAFLLLAPAAGADETLRVISVVPGSPAAAAGVEAGDRLVRLGARKIASHRDLTEILAAHEPGDTVALAVGRGSETVELGLTLGEGPGGGASIGVRLEIEIDPGAGPNAGAAECLAWIEERYRFQALSVELGLDLAADAEAVSACVDHDARRMSREMAVDNCDNLLKVHCAGLDLITEIGDALVERCETHLAAGFGIEPRKHDAWTTCAQHRVFDRYAKGGEASDGPACEAALLACGAGRQVAPPGSP